MADLPKNPVTALVSDLDGTLIDYEGASHEAICAPLARHGFTFDWKVHASIVGRRAHGPDGWASLTLAALGVPAETMGEAELIAEVEVEMKARYATLKEMPGAVALLERLKARGVPIAIATSSARYSFDEKMKHQPRMLALIDVVVCGDDPELERGKPAPDIFLLAAKRLEVEPSTCLVFEDSPFGVQAAKAAGMLCGALPDARLSAENASRFEAADWTLSSLEEFDESTMVTLMHHKTFERLPALEGARPEPENMPDDVYSVLIGDDAELTPEFKAVLKDMFNRFDADGDGALDEKELNVLTQACNGKDLPADELEQIREHFDVDKEGRLTEYGFECMYELQSGAEPEETWRDLAALGYAERLLALSKPSAQKAKKKKALPAKLPKPNEPCHCGSKKKYKKCCRLTDGSL